MINVKITVGIDSFLKENTCKKKRIGLITNQTGITSEGVPTWKAIRSEGYDLSVIFGPEHGFRGMRRMPYRWKMMIITASVLFRFSAADYLLLRKCLKNSIYSSTISRI